MRPHLSAELTMRAASAVGGVGGSQIRDKISGVRIVKHRTTNFEVKFILNVKRETAIRARPRRLPEYDSLSRRGGSFSIR